MAIVVQVSEVANGPLVVIHSGCALEFYGRNCLQNCSENCYITRTCDRKTGVCYGGCVAGWQPPWCFEGTCTLFKFIFTICNSALNVFPRLSI